MYPLYTCREQNYTLYVIQAVGSGVLQAFSTCTACKALMDKKNSNEQLTTLQLCSAFCDMHLLKLQMCNDKPYM